MEYGCFYEELEVGRVYEHGPGRTITEYDDTLFSMLTMNHNPLHIDANYSEQTQHKQRLVVGTLIFSVVVGMSVGDISGKCIANLEYEDIRHLGPTFHGDTIYSETKVLDKWESKGRQDRGVAYVETRAFNQRGETILSFRRKVLLPKREYKNFVPIRPKSPINWEDVKA